MVQVNPVGKLCCCADEAAGFRFFIKGFRAFWRSQLELFHHLEKPGTQKLLVLSDEARESYGNIGNFEAMIMRSAASSSVPQLA